MSNRNITEIEALDGMDFNMLSDAQKTTWEFFFREGRKYGVSLQRISEAPQEELARAKTQQQYDEILSRYPSRIIVSHH